MVLFNAENLEQNDQFLHQLAIDADFKDSMEEDERNYYEFLRARNREEASTSLMARSFETAVGSPAVPTSLVEEMLNSADNLGEDGFAPLFEEEKYTPQIVSDNLLSTIIQNEDINYSVTDNILLRLKNKNSDIATIRIYNAQQSGTDSEKKANPDYKIQVIITYAQSGITYVPEYNDLYSMSQWINGEITAEKLELTDYTVQYIGTMGANFVLAKDETNEAVLSE